MRVFEVERFLLGGPGAVVRLLGGGIGFRV